MFAFKVIGLFLFFFITLSFILVVIVFIIVILFFVLVVIFVLFAILLTNILFLFVITAERFRQNLTQGIVCPDGCYQFTVLSISLIIIASIGGDGNPRVDGHSNDTLLFVVPLFVLFDFIRVFVYDIDGRFWLIITANVFNTSVDALSDRHDIIDQTFDDNQNILCFPTLFVRQIPRIVVVIDIVEQKWTHIMIAIIVYVMFGHFLTLQLKVMAHGFEVRPLLGSDQISHINYVRIIEWNTN